MEEKLDKLKTVQRDILKIVPHNKEEITKIATSLVKSVLDGDQNSLEVDIALRYLELLVSQIRENVFMKKAVLEEAEKYPEKTFKAYGTEITKTSRGAYDYSECNYAYYSKLLGDIAKLNGERKATEKMLQGLQEPMVIEETGEVVNPPSKTSQETIRVKLL